MKFSAKIKGLIGAVQGLTIRQRMIAAAAAVVILGGIGAGAALVYDSFSESVATTNDKANIEKPLKSVTKSAVEAIPEATKPLEVTQVALEPIEPILVKLAGSSMEKDLKIKIQNGEKKNVKGEEFSICVTPAAKNAKASVYQDHDKDGTIYIKQIEAGDYVVALLEIEGYDTNEKSITVTVKEKIEYVQIEVEDEIKTEAEVSPSEDAEKKQENGVENEIKDTLPLLESKTTSTEVSVESLDKTPYIISMAAVGNERDTKALPYMQEQIQTEEEQTPIATVSIPKTASIFISPVTKASEIGLNIELGGSNPDIVDITAAAWEIKESDNLGVTLSKTSGQQIALSAKGAAGTGKVTVVATIPYTLEEDMQTITLECEVTVSTAAYNTTAVLKDGNSILYKDAGCTIQATGADLKTAKKLYKDPKYTGWQSFNGALYYYNERNQAVTGAQVIAGIKYTFASDGSLTKGSGAMGIDVSKWQGAIDWPTVKAAGVKFAIIRVGYRGTQTGVLVEDPYFKQNIKGATAAGIRVGVYFFTQAITEAEAVEEASTALKLTSGYNLSYPIFVDTENGSGNARANGLSKDVRTACVKAFCKTVENAGKKAGVYASKNWYLNKLNTSEVNKYCIWVAQYNTSCTYNGKYNIWQYTSRGSIPGIKGNVDVNISYME